MTLPSKLRNSMPYFNHTSFLDETIKFSFGHVFKRNYGVITPWQSIEKVDLTSAKIIQFVSLEELKDRDIDCAKIKVPLEADWEKDPKKIRIMPTPSNLKALSGVPSHYFFGGLPALMSATRKVMDGSSEPVVYVNNGEISKSIQSGHQAHVHPSEWSTPDCDVYHLTKTLAYGLKLLPPPNPNDLKNYSYLHFPVNRELFFNKENLKLYGNFFKYRILHNLASNKGVSSQDQWLCDMVRKSLDFHQMLSEKIAAKTGLNTLKREYRIYWSQDFSGIAKKKAIWEALGIKCEKMSKEELKLRTLLRDDVDISALKVIGDGKFAPETPLLIQEYLLQEFPHLFSSRMGNLVDIYLNPSTKEPEMIKEASAQGEKYLPVCSVFGSPGHDQVFEYDSVSKIEKQLWKEVPVSGISSLWMCTIAKKDLSKRWGICDTNKVRFEEQIQKISASANLCNLHVTVLNSDIRNSKVQLFVRVSQGANFNSKVADKNDLLNLATNLNQFFIGYWELISAGTCTRKTSISNVPEVSRFFVQGLSGIGYSVSAAPWKENLCPSIFDKFMPK